MENYKRKAAWFLTSQSLSLFGSSVVSFAIIWYVTMQTSSGIWVSLLTISSYLPQFLISFVAGVWADRHSRKKLIIFSDIGIAISTAVLIVLLQFLPQGKPILISLIVVSILRSIGTGIQTPAVNAVITQIVPEESLMKFNSINSTLQSVVQFVAPMVAGSVLSFTNLSISLIIDIATAIVGVGILISLSIPFTKCVDESPSMVKEMKAGFSYSFKEGFIGPLLIIFGLFIFLCVPAGFLASLFVNRYYGDTYWYMSLVELVGFVGMTIEGIILSITGGFKNRVITLVIGLLLFGSLAIGMGLIHNFIVYLVMMAIYGVALTMVQTACTTLLQENTAPEMQGRVFGLFGAMFSGFLPLGMAVFGPLADVMSLRLIMIISGGALIIMGVILIMNKRFVKRGIKKY